MDTSPEYINMCRKATEIQEKWRPAQGDFFYLHDEIECIGDYSEYLHPIDYREEFPISKKHCVWLPRIDQLIEMFQLGWKAMLQDILNFVKPGDTPSIESECIKAIMYYNHDKSWNGEDWI